VFSSGTLQDRRSFKYSVKVLWMLRLGYNTWRRGLFGPGGEDYRWAALRQRSHPLLFQIFNITFISFAQNWLLLSLSFPAYLTAAALPEEPLTSIDFILFTTGVLLLAVEFTADNQQWAFQNYKKLILAYEKFGDDVDAFTPNLPSSAYWPFALISNFTPVDAHRGFITKGLWAWSRHPNFLCEQSVWARNIFIRFSPDKLNSLFRS
jgi:steroid 5-alpha reductase family enzyme